MNRKLSFFLAFWMVIFCLTGCRGRGSESAQKLTLTTSFYPVYIMALNIVDGVDGVSLNNMSQQAVGCLHDFQLQSADVKNIEASDALIINGVGMESFLDKVLKECPNVAIIDSSIGIPLLHENSHEHAHEHEGAQYNSHEHAHAHDDEHEDVNAHIWVSISNYEQQVKNISKGIIALDPENTDAYEKNTRAYLQKLEELKLKMHRRLDDLSRKDIITFHEAFPYFAQEFDLNIVAVINREPNSEPSPQELADTISLVKKAGVPPLFVEPQYPNSAANIIAAETGAKIYTLDPAVTGDLHKDAYINIMEKNLLVLEEALG